MFAYIYYIYICLFTSNTRQPVEGSASWDLISPKTASHSYKQRVSINPEEGSGKL